MSCRVSDDGPAGLDEVLSEPEAEDGNLRGPEVPTVLVVSPRAYGLGRGAMSKCQYILPQRLVGYQGWLASTFYLMVPTPTVGSALGLGTATRQI